MKELLQGIDSPEPREEHERGVEQANCETEDVIRIQNSSKLRIGKSARKGSAPFLINPRFKKLSVRHAFIFELHNQVPKFRKSFEEIAGEYCSLFASLDGVQRFLVTHQLTKGPTYNYRYIGCFLDLSVYRPWSDEEPTEGQLNAIEKFKRTQVPFDRLISEFNLEKPWIRESLMDALDSRRICPTASVLPMLYQMHSFRSEEFNFTLPGIEYYETLKSYSARAKAKFDEALKEYLSNTEDDAESNGLKRPGGRPVNLGQVKDYVSWAFLGNTLYEIFIAAGADDSNSDGGKSEFKPNSIRRKLTRLRDDWDLPDARDKTSRKKV